MKDDYFVMFKKSITLVFNALICKYESIHTCIYKWVCYDAYCLVLDGSACICIW